MKILIATLAMALACGLAGTSAAAQTVDQPLPLRVKVVTPDGKKKLKVAKRVRVFTSCSKDCRARVVIKLITPVNTLRFRASRGLPAQSVWTVGTILTRQGLRYLKDNFRRSRFQVTLAAKDLETGKRVTKKRTYRFRR